MYTLYQYLFSEFIWTIPLAHATLEEINNPAAQDIDPRFDIDWIYREKEREYLFLQTMQIKIITYVLCISDI